MEDLKNRLRFLQEIERKEMLEDSEEQAQKIINEAEKKASITKSQKIAEISKNLQEIEDSELAILKLEERKKISNYKFQLFEESLEQCIKNLEKMIKDTKPRYKKSLKKLIVEAAMKLKGTEFEIVANSRDKKIIEEKLEEIKGQVSLAKGETVKLHISHETLDTMGGALVRTKDKRQMFNNTLEARLSKVKEESAGSIFEILFEGAQD